jgi:hypothetical protein
VIGGSAFQGGTRASPGASYRQEGSTSMTHTAFIWKCLIFGTITTLAGLFFLGVMLFTWDWAAWPALFIFFGPGALFFGLAYLKEFWF